MERITQEIPEAEIAKPRLISKGMEFAYVSPWDESEIIQVNFNGYDYLFADDGLQVSYTPFNSKTVCFEPLHGVDLVKMVELNEGALLKVNMGDRKEWGLMGFTREGKIKVATYSIASKCTSGLKMEGRDISEEFFREFNVSSAGV